MRFTATITAAVFGSVALFAGSASADVVTTADLNMRKGPSLSAEVVTLIPKDSDVMVGECVREFRWCEASFDGVRGWVSSAYLTEGRNAEAFPYDAEISDARVVPQDPDWTDSESLWRDDDDERFEI